MSIEPTSDKTEIKEFKVKGKVAASDNNLPLQGVNVSINTTQGDFKTKTTEDGSYTFGDRTMIPWACVKKMIKIS